MSSPTQSHATSTAPGGTRIQYEEWDKAHQRMKERPPKEPRSYLRHARNLLPLLESIAELNPIAKAVVFSFKAVINFQYDRIENDLRVTSVFLSQTDMMRVILEIHPLVEGMDDPSEIGLNEHLQEILLRVQKDIEQCGSDMDTYNKETRLVKFLKSQEWKQRMIGYNQSFIDHRIVLQQALSIHTARGVVDMKASMKKLLDVAFTPQLEWELKLSRQLQQFGPKENWINDNDKVQALLKSTGDPRIDPHLFAVDNQTVGGDAENQRQRAAPLLQAIKDELNTQLDDLCERNMELFTQKLEFQRLQLEERIKMSAEYVVRELQGPYDRVNHEDLRKLWKEMSWIFCVKGNLFSISLYEYYLDAFLLKAKSSIKAGDAEGQQNAEGAPKLPEDRWTLRYLQNYSQQITNAVDNDQSGYIRISEVNAFTAQMPPNWTLPQWCAFAAVGWEYELHIYQKRVQGLLDRVYQAQMLVLPHNRNYTGSILSYRLQKFESLSRGPDCYNYFNLPDTFCARIREKIKNQDEKYRGYLKTFRHRIDDEATLRQIYSGKSLESYVLQLCTLLLENLLNVLQVSQTQTIDYWDFNEIGHSFIVLDAAVRSRLTELHTQLQRERLDVDENMKTFYGGLFRIVHLEMKTDESSIQWTPNEVLNRISDAPTTDDFPLPHLDADLSVVLKHPTWEAHLRDLPHDTPVPDVPPITWGDQTLVIQPSDEKYLARVPSFFPWHFGMVCNGCGSAGVVDKACYSCCNCDCLDLCADCLAIPKEKWQIQCPEHESTHGLIKCILAFPYPYRLWIVALGRHLFAIFSNEQQTRLLQKLNEPSENVDSVYTCNRCRYNVPFGTLYKCMQGCEDFHLCPNCEQAIAMDHSSVGNHHWWHTLLALHYVDFQLNNSAPTWSEPEQPTVAEQPDMEERMARMETRMSQVESSLQNLEVGIKELKDLLLGGYRAPAEPTQAQREVVASSEATPSARETPRGTLPVKGTDRGGSGVRGLTLNPPDTTRQRSRNFQESARGEAPNQFGGGEDNEDAEALVEDAPEEAEYTDGGVEEPGEEPEDVMLRQFQRRYEREDYGDGEQEQPEEIEEPNFQGGYGRQQQHQQYAGDEEPYFEEEGYTQQQGYQQGQNYYGEAEDDYEGQNAGSGNSYY